ncbi:MAG TPA: hypothetical protein DDW94_00360 [Deltaproteobacteria bacterium]|nr:MAG: hypothetical protein A2Z79_05725 [Deltaproteobacteria bacterium GWA2_55_82]OGQ62398.1 MAG: hypothetical protein A3I81_01320 [Deltaproteobacteria bacterium RIFCSPLOWO2_02_FULL_55_12]OIJ73310.1 MAG: hypothetical protein A2V21_302935 [Deltaproteobacteria bacterium GWC2_55_46]HBG45420.1 hypothetical protein [Deltaproteobacteria bacterium]HCY10251.1 hypothetical protein [Deltaproteobacteria bacterium]
MKSVLILLVVFFLVRALKKSLEAKSARVNMPGQPGTERTTVSTVHRESEEMVLDQICGSYVPVSAAIMSDAGGKRSYYCSEECRSKAEQGR